MLVHRSGSSSVRCVGRWQAKALICIASAALLLAVDPSPCSPSQVVQTLTAGLQGTVTDAAGQPLAGVAVNYRNLERNLEGGTITSA